MTMPVLMLLGFAAWTLVLLIVTVGVYRCGRIFRGRASFGDFPADHVVGEDWYRRSMRAHANCVENLPVFGAIVFALSATGVGGLAVNCLCIGVLVARIAQSLVHVGHVQTDGFVAVRFSFFSVQLVSFMALIAIIMARATQTS